VGAGSAAQLFRSSGSARSARLALSGLARANARGATALDAVTRLRPFALQFPDQAILRQRRGTKKTLTRVTLASNPLTFPPLPPPQLPLPSSTL
jgi:hypothetical protein